MLFNNKDCDTKQRFSIRKLTIGTCSVLLATLFLTTNNPQRVRATIKGNDSEEAEVVQAATIDKTKTPANSERAGDSTFKGNEIKNSVRKDTPKAGLEKKASEVQKSSDALNTTAKTDQNNTKLVELNSPKADTEGKTTFVLGKNKTPINADALKASKVNTKDTVLNWGNHRYIMDADLATHPTQYWDNRVKEKVMPWILQENNNEGATFKSWEFTSQGTYDGDNWTPNVDANQKFCYPSGNLVVTNKNGTSTTTYNGITINIAKSIASYFRGKYREFGDDNTVLSDANAQNTYITVHANSENPFTQVIPNSSIDKIVVGGWTYGTQGDNAQVSRDYLLSLIREIKLTDANISQNGPTHGQFAITFTDSSVLQGKKGNINVVGGVAQTGLTVAKDSDFTFKYQNATSGVTSDSQGKIAKWQPTYVWVDKDGNAIGPSNPYNTSTNFDAYVKINYNLDGKADGSQIVKVPVTISTTEHVNITISGDGKQTATYKGSAFNSSNLDLNKFQPSFSVTDGKAIPTPTSGNELTSADYEIKGDPTNVGSYDVYLNANGIAKVKKWNNSNLHIWSNETSAKVGTFTIEKAKPTVTFNGTGSKAYNGKPLSDDDYTTPIGLSYENAAGMGNNTISLTAGTDYEWYLLDENGHKTGNALKEAPSAAGKYTIELTTTGKNKITGSSINSANLDWANATIKTDTSYVINKAPITVDLEGNGAKIYNGQPVTTDELSKKFSEEYPGISIKISISLNNEDDQQVGQPIEINYKLQDGDYTWRDTLNGDEILAGGSENKAPTNVIPGSDQYHIEINSDNETLINHIKAAVIDKYPALAGNFDINDNSFGDEGGKFTIIPAPAEIKQDGSAEKPYDGSAASVELQTLLDHLKASLTDNKPLYGKDTLDTSGLTLSDFDWYNGDQDLGSVADATKAPINAGSYTIKLNKSGLEYFAYDYSDGNYSFVDIDKQTPDDPGVRYSGEFKYIIKKADINVSGNGTQTTDYDGTAFGKDVTGLDLSKFVPTLSAGTTEKPVTTPPIPANTLSASDFTIENQDGTPNATPTKVGTYKVYLNTAGIAKLKALDTDGNFTWPAEAVQVGTFTIKSVEASATITSSTGRTYDGKATTSSDLNAVASITVPGTDPISYTLVDGDYTWNTTNHAAPINASDTAYTITLTNAGIEHLQKAINDKIGAGNVAITSADVSNKASYKIDKATATVNFTNGSGQTVAYTGETGKFDASKFTPTISTNNGQSLSIPSGVSLSLAAGDFTINGVETTTEPTALGTYTIGLSKAGFEKLQSATDNYNWVNNAKATYIIQANDKATVTVTNKTDGGQKVVYKAANYGTNDIDINDYRLTLPTGLSYTLKAGDLEIVPNATGTKDVGTYTVQLSDQGKRNLAAAGGNNFKFDFTKPGVANTSATFEITKATPTVVFNGVGSKTFGQNDTQWSTPTGLTITAPGNPTIALVAEDYEFVGSDGTVYSSIPTNVGTYTVRLSAKGKQLITGSTINSANLDWANAKISGEGTFTVKAVEGKAVLSGSNSRDYNGSAVTTTDINNGGTITVTISIPGTDKTISYKLQDGDYTWKDNANTTNVGTYTIELNKANILAHLQDSIKNDKDWNGNVTLVDADLSGIASFEVKAKAATVSLSGDDTKNGPRYNGSAVSTPLDALKNALSSNGTVSGEKLDLTAVTTAGFDWYDASGKKLNSAPTDHGVYTIKLNETGLGQIQTKNPNYKLSIDKNAYLFKIKTARGSVAFSGSHEVAFGTTDSNYSKDYTVKLTTDPATINGFTPSFTLEDGDLEFSTDGNTWSSNVPTTVGTYKVKLTDKARNKLVDNNSLNGNVKWPATNFSGIGSYTVTPAQATANLSGSAKRPYNGSAVTITDINNSDSTIGVTISLPNNKTATYKLVAGDYEWVNGSDPTNVGTYELNLTDKGKSHLQDWLNKDDVAGLGLDNKPNVLAPTEVTGTASFEITPVAIAVTQSGSGSKTYDGTAANVTVADLTNNNNWSATGMIGGQNFNVPEGLTLSDFDWYKVNADNSETKLDAAPTDAGNYALKLNADGLKKLQDANTNYSFTAVSGQYNYVINQANAEISLNETTNKQSATWTGSEISLDLSKFIPAIKDTSNNKEISYPTSVALTAGDYKITQNGQAATAQEPGTYQIQLTEQGWQKVRDAISGHDNYKWAYSGNGVLTISKKSQAITISGLKTVTYSGSSAVIPTDSDGNLIGYTVDLGNGLTYQLKSGDLAFVDADHTNVGTYKLKLTEAGLDNIKKLAEGNHYDYQYTYDVDNTATLIVDPATAIYTLSGSQNSIYNGSPASIDLNKDNSYSITIKMNNGQNVTYQLKTEDLALKSGSNPTARGKYDVVLSDTGLQHLKAINANYTWDAANSTSTAYYEINPAEMFVGLGGETNSVFNNAIQPVPTDKLSDLHIVWGGSNTKPSDVANTISIQAGDFDYYTKNADGTFTKVDPTKGPKDAGHYYLFLNDAGLKRLSDANPNGNYTFALPTEQNSKNAATYTINQLAAKVTLTGEQTAEYGYAQVLNPKNYSVVLKDKDGNVIGTVNGNDLQVGDLLINGYTTTDGHPTDVGTYAVEIQQQLINKLKQKFPNFNFDAVTSKDVKSDGTSDSVTDKNNNGIYVITTIDANIAISGRQEVPYNSNNSYSIDNSKYLVTLTDKHGKSIAIPDNIKKQLEFKFVTKPTDAGDYEVTLTDNSIKLIESIGTQNSNGLNNYAWLTDNIKAQPYVVTPLQIAATVSNKNSKPASSIYGKPINLNDHLNEYTITLVDKTTGKPIAYTLQKDDLEFVNGEPTTTGEFAVQLSPTGIANVEKQYPTKNYAITFDHTATYKVIAATPTVTITANGDSQKTYDAQPAEIKSGDFTVSITTNNGQTINETLNSADLEFDGSAPTDVGQYDVKLKPSAINRLKDKYPNYNWDVDSVTKAVGKYTITAADGSAVLSGNVSKSYDGSGISDLSPIKVTVDYPGVGSNTTYTLTNDDYVIVNDQTNKQYKPNEAPADVGSYHIELTTTGKANIAKLGNTEHKNINWTDKSYTGNATYAITAIDITVSGQGKQDVTYDGTAFGNEDKLDLNKFVPTLNAGTVSVPEIPTGTLTADDYTIKNSKGETVTDPTNAGKYAVWLNENGLKKLKNLSSNFTWPTAAIKVGTLNIAQTDASAKLSGSNSKTYDGKAVSTEDINNGGNITLQVTVNGKTYDYALQDGDYTWANGEAPINVGEYTDKIILDTTGTLISHLTEFINGQNKDLVGNFKFDTKNLTGSASFNIDQKDATVIQGGSGSKTYDGTAGSVTLEQLINNLTSNDLVSGQTLKTSGLTLDDFAWSGPDKDHIVAGDYTIALTPAGLAKLKKDNPNYKLTVTGSFKYTINQATASAKLSGSGEKTYNGDPVSDADIQKSDNENNITVKVTIPGVKDPQTVTLGVNDFDWTGGKVPTVAGTYTLTLNAAGKAAIKDKFADNKNIDWTKTSFSGSATYTIKKADGKIEFTGSDSKTFDNKEVLPSDLDGNKFYVTVNGQQIALPENGYEIVDADGKKVTPKNAGTYYIVLTDQGLADLEKDTNYSWTPNWNGTTRPNQIGTYVINQAKAIPTISGSNNKTYNGLPTKLAEVTKDGKIKVTVDSGNTEFTIPDYVLTAGDYDWYGADGNKISAPTVVGHYIIKLSTQGLQNIQAYLDKTYGKNNVAFDQNKNSGQADFDINPFEITVTIKGTVTVDAGTTTIPDGKYNFDFAPTKSNTELPNGWAKPAIPVSDLDFDGQKPTAETKNGTFTVNYKGAQEALQKLLGNNYEVTYVAGKDNYIVSAQAQKVEIRFIDDDDESKVVETITKDGVTGQKIDLNLTVPKNYQLAKGQKLPEDYTFKANGNDPIEIHLVHKTQNVSESKTITRTIIENLPSGKQTKLQKVVLERTGVKDLVTGKTKWNAWSTGKWEKFIPTAVDGYIADRNEVPEENVTSNTKDQTIEINYTEIPDQTPDDQPTKPDQPVVPENPDQPEQPAKPSKPIIGPNGNKYPAGSVVGADGSIYDQNGKLIYDARKGQHGKHKKTLPQTGADHNSFAAAIGAMFASLGILGLAGDRKKKKDQDKD